jgi:hypothetical protein
MVVTLSRRLSAASVVPHARTPHAHVIIPEGGRNDAAFDMLVARLKEFA